MPSCATNARLVSCRVRPRCWRRLSGYPIGPTQAARRKDLSSTTSRLRETNAELRDKCSAGLLPSTPTLLASAIRLSDRTDPSRQTKRPEQHNEPFTGDQCRAARQMLGWSLAEHAHVAGVGCQAIRSDRPKPPDEKT